MTEATDPDWVPVMKRAAGIITDHGGATSHAAIVSRELGLLRWSVPSAPLRCCAMDRRSRCPAPRARRATSTKDGFRLEVVEVEIGNLPDTRTAMMVNVASPAAAFRWWRLPTKGIGLARMEFIISSLIHPMALVHFEAIRDAAARREIENLTRGYVDKSDYFVDVLARGNLQDRGAVASAPGHCSFERLQVE